MINVNEVGQKKNPLNEKYERMNVYDSSGLSRYYYVLITLMGVFVTMPIVAFPVAGRYISVFTVLLVLFLMYRGMNISIREVAIDRYNGMLVAILVLSIFSAVWGYMYFIMISAGDGWETSSITRLPKIIFLLLLCLLWPNNRKSCELFLKGFLVGCIVNAVWSIVDAAGFYITGTSINNVIFSSYAIDNNIHFGVISIVREGLIRASAFNPDPAAIGFMEPFLLGYALYNRKWILVIIAALSILSSASTTAMVGSFFVFFIVVWIRMNYHSAQRKANTYKRPIWKRNNSLISLAVIILAMIIGCIFFRDRLSALMSLVADKALGRMYNQYFSGAAGSDIRVGYAAYLPAALFTAPINLLFGTGWGTSSYAYAFNTFIMQGLSTNIQFAYDPENTYIDIILDIGIVGFIMMTQMFIRILRYYRKKINQDKTSIIIFFAVFSMIFSGLFYHYVLYTPQYIILLLALKIMSMDKKEP